jgi:rare lipoprotein A
MFSLITVGADRRRASVAIALGLACLSWPAQAESPVQSAAKADLGQIVRASWYGGGNEHLSRYTASGEVFRPWDRTAAHRSLPFGTRLQVTYRGLSTIVRINDRGPGVNTGRALDLSRGAASDLGMFGAGDVRVAIRVIN